MLSLRAAIAAQPRKVAARVSKSTLARLLLAKATEEADPGEHRMTAILDRIPGAYERSLQSAERAGQGNTIWLEDL